MRHHGAFLGESRHVLRFATEEGFGDEEREICVLHARLLEHLVKRALHLLPDGVAVGFDDHASAHGGLLCEICFQGEIVVPLGIIVRPFGNLFCHIVVEKLRFFAKIASIIQTKPCGIIIVTAKIKQFY